jgi:FixJ family two-component response regulator
MSDDAPVVYVVDDDVAVLRALERLFKSVHLDVQSCNSAHEFLQHERADAPGCLVLDVRLPGLSGLDLQAELTKNGGGLPIVFITGHGDIPMSVRAMKGGAVDFLPKPFKNQDLLNAAGKAIEQDRKAKQDAADRTEIEERLGLLTNRERQVMDLVVNGFLNKQIASRLEIAEATVKVHRGRVMHKMEVESVAELARLAEKTGISATKS